ncbi:MAG: ABC transporter ATP-binding protein [Lachnospiraceae bacterium]|nr:ABC transporter ATP-binding protein [Lachnospiraceae bacterium]
MIYVNELSKDFGRENNRTIVLNNVSWTASNGMITGLFGRKKSGKTVALRVLTGIQSFRHGQVLIDSRDITEEFEDARSTFGYVPDTMDQFRALTGEQYLNFMSDVYGVDEDSRESFLKTWLPKLNLDLILKDRMAGYTKGNYKKMLLLGAMIYEPNNLILDNILEGLELQDMESVKEILREYARKGKTVFLADDRLRIAENFCDHIIYLVNGRVRFKGSCASMLEKYREAGSLDAIDRMLSDEFERKRAEEQNTEEFGLRLFGRMRR